MHQEYESTATQLTANKARHVITSVLDCDAVLGQCQILKNSCHQQHCYEYPTRVGIYIFVHDLYKKGVLFEEKKIKVQKTAFCGEQNRNFRTSFKNAINFVVA